MGSASSRRLLVQYPNRRALLANARAEGALLSLFVPSREQVPLGTEVTLEVTVAGTALHFVVQGQVRLRISALGRPDPGLGIAFEGDQKRAVAKMLALCAGRSLDHGTALDSRHEVDVRCLVKLPGARVKGAIRDVSNTGAFIGARKLQGLRGDAELTIQLEPLFGRWGGRLLRARVIWVGEKRGVPGFGVRFTDATAHVRESLKKHLAPG